MNIPERLRMHVSSQLSELYVKHNPDPNTSPRAVVNIAQITLSSVPHDIEVIDDHEAAFEITQPTNLADPSTYQSDNSGLIRNIVNIISNPQNIDSALIDSWSDGNHIYCAISAGYGSEVAATMALSSPLLLLSERTVRIKAFGNIYVYTFPAGDNMTEWLPILTYGIISFAKE